MEWIKGTNNYIPQLISLKVGSQSSFNTTGFENLKGYVNAPKKEWEAMLLHITRTIIVESHKLWTMRNWKDAESTFITKDYDLHV